MCIRDLADMNALGPAALMLWAYMSGKFLMPMLQLLHYIANNYTHIYILYIKSGFNVNSYSLCNSYHSKDRNTIRSHTYNNLLHLICHMSHK